MRHRDDRLPVPQPEPSTGDIVPAHHEAMSAVLMATLEEVVAVKRRVSMCPISVQRTGCLGKTIHRLIATKPYVRRRPHKGYGKGCIVGKGEVTQKVLRDAAIAGCGGREGVKSRQRVPDDYSIQASSDK
ncbi:hypothetical protein E2C01_065812 [Portunus trituberculatus]|uniref:Uncharacterized protein n=1 Tax=Portunus trituberculatus TaxID=210409 RepID=A0A5B7HPF5_PORTR|nr:hypothetical protein [Portunus trituberculatus]